MMQSNPFLVEFEPGVVEQMLSDVLAERCLSLEGLAKEVVEDLVGTILRRIQNGRLELCIAPDVPMNGTHDTVFRLHLGE